MSCAGCGAELLPTESFCAGCGLYCQPIGNYLLQSLVCDGNFARVYRGSYASSDYPVAIKFFKEKYQPGEIFQERFEREVHILQSLRHPFVVRTFDEGWHQDMGIYVVMEWLDGQSLEDWCLQENRPTLHRRLVVLMQLLEAIAYLHSHAIVHRDLKLSNAMVVKEHGKHVLKLLDFGISLRLEQDRLTQANETLGTPGFMAPEQIQGKTEQIGFHTDTYAVGAILFWLLTGRMVFVGANSHEICWKHCHTQPPTLRIIRPELALSAGWDDLLQKALHKDPLRRYRNIRDLQHDLQVLWQEELSKEETLPTPAEMVDTVTPLVFGPREEWFSAKHVPLFGRPLLFQIPMESQPTATSTDAAPQESRLRRVELQPQTPVIPHQPPVVEDSVSRRISTPVATRVYLRAIIQRAVFFLFFVGGVIGVVWLWLTLQGKTMLASQKLTTPNLSAERSGVLVRSISAPRIRHLSPKNTNSVQSSFLVVQKAIPQEQRSLLQKQRKADVSPISRRVKMPSVKRSGTARTKKQARVRLLLRSIPSKATVFQHQKRIGSTPVNWMVLQGKPLRFLLIKPGYQSCQLDWNALQHGSVVIHLVDDVGIPSATIPCRTTHSPLAN